MASAHLIFSFEFPVPDAQVGWVREVIELIENAESGVELEEGNPLLAVFPGYNEWGEAGFDIWQNPNTGQCGIDAEDYGNTENVCSFLLAFLGKCYETNKEFNEIGFSYAYFGDGEPGGGAIRCFLDGSKPEVEYITTDGWLSEAFRGKGN